MLVPITSDKGLCGGVNANVVREVKSYMAGKDINKCKIMVCGNKGAGALSRPFPNSLTLSLEEISSPYNYPTIMAVAEHIQ